MTRRPVGKTLPPSIDEIAARIARLTRSISDMAAWQAHETGLPDGYRAKTYPHTNTIDLRQHVCTIKEIALARMIEAEFGITLRPGCERWWSDIQQIAEAVRSNLPGGRQ